MIHAAHRQHEHNSFLQDLFAFFNKTKQGHMEKWEYASPRFKNDPASGALAWSKLIENQGIIICLREIL